MLIEKGLEKVMPKDCKYFACCNSVDGSVLPAAETGTQLNRFLISVFTIEKPYIDG